MKPEIVLCQGEANAKWEPALQLSSLQCCHCQHLTQLQLRHTLVLHRDARSAGAGTTIGALMRSANIGMFVECARVLVRRLIAVRECSGPLRAVD